MGSRINNLRRPGETLVRGGRLRPAWRDATTLVGAGGQTGFLPSFVRVAVRPRPSGRAACLVAKRWCGGGQTWHGTTYTWNKTRNENGVQNGPVRRAYTDFLIDSGR